MILADTSIWIDHFRSFNPELDKLLRRGDIAMHPSVVAEISLGSMRERRKTLADLDRLMQLKVANPEEIRFLIESKALYSRGIGLIDASLAASCLITPGTELWTRDTALGRVAELLSIRADLS